MKSCHGLDADNECYLCDQDPETIDHIITMTHLVAHFDGARDRCRSGGGWGSITDWWKQWRQRWHGEKKKGADTLFTLMACEL